MMKQTIKRLSLLGLVLVLALGLLAGCGAKSESAADTASSTEMAPGDAGFQNGTENWEAQKDEAALEESGEAASDSAADSAEQPQNTTDFTEKIIYSGNLTVETTAFDEALQQLNQMVDEFDGFLQNSDVSGYTSTQPDGSTRVVDRSAWYVVRIPCERFSDFMQQAGSIGNVVQNNTSAENITSQYTDREAYLTSLRTQEERLLELMEQADTIDALIALESQLSQVRYEIETTTRQLNDWQQQVDYSTVTVNLVEVASYTPTADANRSFGQKLSAALGDGWRGFIHGLEALALAVVSALPVLVLLAIAVVVVVVLVRRGKKRAAARRAQQIAASQQLPQQPPAEKE